MARSAGATVLCRGRRGTLLGAVALLAALRGIAFVSSPLASQTAGRADLVLRKGSAAASPDPSKPPKKEAAEKDKEIDDAVLAMAMAITEEEEKGPAAAAPVRGKTQEKGFDFSSVISVFWIVVIIYSFGSSFIAISQGRMQDRTGGDFTAYDFFDNIFAFKEWSFEYTLGFDPFKLWAQLTGATPEPADLDL